MAKNIIYNFRNSNKRLEESLKLIPLASQTFSKSKVQFPLNYSPFFAKNAKGCKITDVDDNEYIDFINSLACVILGYQNTKVDAAVKKQMKQGTIFSLSSDIEFELAQRIVDTVPCAQMVRFGKNGSDVTSAAIRCARAYTKKDKIAICGYHGWHDWYIGTTTRNLGVPKEVQNLSLKFEYNNIDSLSKIFQENKGEVAAVIMEPMNLEYPKDDFLQKVKDLAHQNNALLIFDEIVTGFRYSIGGAQEYFSVTPDLTSIGKGMANGYPMSAIVGSRKIMETFEDIFFSGTFGGECLSIAASITTIDIIKNNNVPKYLFDLGSYLVKELKDLINRSGLDSFLSVQGHPSWSFLVMRDYKNYSSFHIKTLFMQETIKRGILSIGTHNLSYSHKKSHIDYLLLVYEEIFSIFKDAIINDNFDKYIKAEILKPLFKIR